MHNVEARLQSYRERIAKLKGQVDTMRITYDAVKLTLAQVDEQNERLREALEIVAGKRQCVDNTMSNREVANAALAEEVRDLEDARKMDRLAYKAEIEEWKAHYNEADDRRSDLYRKNQRLREAVRLVKIRWDTSASEAAVNDAIQDLAALVEADDGI